jgi:hypothetical protein
MIDNVFEPIVLSGPLKLYGSSKPNQVNGDLTGWFYPLFLTRKEAIQEDIDRGGKGVYRVITFYDIDGEFYVSDSYGVYGALKDPFTYTLHTGKGAENPFARIQNRLSLLIENQLPEFVQTDYSMFITFIKAYYEFMEQNNQAQELLQDITKYADIDQTSEDMISKFLENYAYDISASKISENKFLLKKIREIYSRKGTEESYRILFNILYKETIDFFYPYDIVLKPSSGKWSEYSSLRVRQTDLRQNVFEFKDTEIIGATSKSTAVVTNVQKIDLAGNDVYELILDTSKTKGFFIGGELISAAKSILLNDSIDRSNLQATLYSVISNINVVDGKLGYKQGNYIQSIIDNDGIGKFAKAKISSVNSVGSIVSVELENSGINYGSNVIIITGPPTESLTGTYNIKNGIVTITFPIEHKIKKGTLLNIFYTGNVYSPVQNTSHRTEVITIPDIRSIRFKYPGF